MRRHPRPHRHRGLIAALALLPALLVGGCAMPEKTIVREVRVEVPVPQPTPEVLPADAAARELLAYHARLRALPPAELAAELRPRDESTPGAATRLALALMTSHATGELVRAQALLDQVLRDPTPEAAAWKPLARLLADSLAEQRRLDDQAERQGQQLRDLQRRLDAANEKLEALKAIERSLGAPRNPQGERR
ncbi:hypothetical protein SNE35_28355 [Paucibacter sp. R3-3]|uniref:Permease n=1 Tax=Roseateles agri TaxID=3098619 RepID=A0ABU5DQ51_9BURK|nr:hypothetical protein [Paucibacter sp. R3-3]MDY0748445.1 hypothetical protein [Paucibacter sp. R3-3]